MKLSYYGVFLFSFLLINLSFARGFTKTLEEKREKSDSYDSLKAKIHEKDSEDRKKQKNMYNGLLKFMLKHGAVIRKFSVKYATNSNRYIYATRDIKKNEVIARIPEKLIIFIGNKEIQSYQKKLKNITRMLQEPNGAVFGLWVLDHKKDAKKRSKTFFKRYFDLLPSDNSNFPALFRKAEEKKYFKSSRILRENLEEKIKPLKEDFRNLQANGYIDKNLTADDYIEAVIDYYSRNFWIDYKGGANAMIPFVDLFNYDEKKNMVTWEYRNESKDFVIWATDDMKKGQEILLNYGYESNQHFLESYGFTTPSIHDPDVTIERDGIKMTLSAELNKESYHSAIKPVFEKFMKEGSTSRTVTRLNALNFFISTIKDYMKEYTTSLKSDQKRFKNEKSFNMKNILRILINEKKIFNYYLNSANEELTNLNDSGDEHETAERDEQIVINEPTPMGYNGFRKRNLHVSRSRSHHRHN